MSVNILCIDDIEANLFTIKSVLESNGDVNYTIFTALSAHEGFDILLKHNIDLILLDVMMPEVDGFKAAKMIKSNKRTKDIPIIFVTAKKDDATVERCYEVGARDYVTKPFNATELIKRVDLQLRLKEKERLLQNEKAYVQNILDLQENMIIVTDGIKLINVNKSFLDFYDKKSLLDVQEDIICLLDTFDTAEGFFSTNKVSDGEFWIDVVLKDLEAKRDVVVKIKNYLNDFYIFILKATKFQEFYILTLTDITATSTQAKEFEHEANYDPLTQIFNRKAFERLLNNKIADYKYRDSTFIYVMLDIDHFKNVNDTYGHQVGDEVLKQVVDIVNNYIRNNDIFARVGGEEFVLILDTNIIKGVSVVNHLREFIADEKFPGVEKLTCSFGVTEYKKGDAIADMMHRADKALYEAKNSGRNKVCKEI